MSIPFIAFQLNPSRNLPQLTVTYFWANTSPEIIEKEVTRNLEAVFATIGTLSKLKSRTDSGSGEITLIFDGHADIDKVYLEVASLIRQVYPRLPERVSYPAIAYTSQKDEKNAILSFQLSAPVSPILIGKFIDNNIYRHLSDIHEIEDIVTTGIPTQILTLTLNRSKLGYYDITFFDVEEALSNYFEIKELGSSALSFFESSLDNEIFIKASFYEKDQKTLLEIPIKKWGNKVLLLSDLASFKMEEEHQKAFSRVNGKNTVGFSIMTTENVNQIKLANVIRERLDQVSDYLPNNWKLEKSYDASIYLTNEVKKLYIRSIASLIVLSLFVFLTFWSFRYTLLILAAVLVTILITTLLVYLLKIEVNLFSLAGAAFSVGLLIDNSIIMIEHWRLNKNREVMRSILGATLTTGCVLGVIFFIDQQLSIYLIDFALIIIVSLSVSLLCALFFIPSLVNTQRITRLRSMSRKRFIIKINHAYATFLHLSVRFRLLIFTLLILLFGIPFFLMPESFPGNSWAENLYNKHIGNEYYQVELKPKLQKWLGGTSTSFISNLMLLPFDMKKERLAITIDIYLPPGHQVDDIDHICKQIEYFLAQFSTIEEYITTIYNKEYASIKVYPKEAFYKSDIPLDLQFKIQAEVLNIGSAAFSVYGISQLGFGNRVTDNNYEFGIKVSGYNKIELEKIVEREKRKLDKNKKSIKSRIVSEQTRFSSNKKIYQSAWNQNNPIYRYEISPQDLLEEFTNRTSNGKSISPIVIANELKLIKLQVNRPDQMSLNLLENQVIKIDTFSLPLKKILDLNLKDDPKAIIKEDQLYQLIIEHSAKGSVRIKKAFHKDQIEKVNNSLPLGYRAEDSDDTLNADFFSDKIWILIAAIISIFLVCACLLNSFKQAFVIISFIPMSYIGIFLIFTWYDAKFDLGGIVSFLLITGITVNSIIYIINEFNRIKRAKNGRGKDLDHYIKALNAKIIPILLTIISTILGFLPFIVDGQQELFWFSLAVGTIGGLVFSFLALIIFFPACFLNRKSLRDKSFLQNRLKW